MPTNLLETAFNLIAHGDPLTGLLFFILLASGFIIWHFINRNDKLQKENQEQLNKTNLAHQKQLDAADDRYNNLQASTQKSFESLQDQIIKCNDTTNKAQENLNDNQAATSAALNDLSHTLKDLMVTVNNNIKKDSE